MSLLQTLPPSAEAYGAAQRAEIGAALSALLRLWRRMGENFDASWIDVGPRMLQVLDLAQERVAAGSLEFIPAVLAETGQTVRDLEYDVEPRVLAGTAGDGRPTESLLYGAVTHAKEAVAAGASASAALAQAAPFLTMAAGTALSDTGRTAEKMAGHSRSVTRYVRMLSPPSCGRCIQLAGESSGRTAFKRHPSCFPAGAVVSGPAPEAATRRWYEGELAIVRTASGKELTATGNHPVLTDQGWIPAGLLKVGDRVLSSTLPQGAVPLVVPDKQQAPSRIEDVWGSDGMVPLGQVPTAAEDFHGDGGHGEVDVVLPDRLLWHRHDAASHEGIVEELLSGGVEYPAGLAGLSSGEQLLHGLLYAPDGFVRGGGLGGAGLGGHLLCSVESGAGPVADLHPVLGEALPQGISAHSEALAEAVLALSSLVGGHDLGVRQRENAARWDAPAGPLTVESRVAYASRGQDLAQRLSSQVASDRVVKVERVQWSGHVYNLTSAEGWYSADGFIVSNCDCRSIPVSESVAGDLAVDRHAYLDGLDDGQLAKALGSKANAQAYRDGADLDQLINAYRKGIKSAQVYSERITYTTEGTTARGVAYRAMKAAGLVDRTVRAPGQRYFRTTSFRLMPETVYSRARNRDEAIAMLKVYGWIRPTQPLFRVVDGVATRVR